MFELSVVSGRAERLLRRERYREFSSGEKIMASLLSESRCDHSGEECDSVCFRCLECCWFTPRGEQIVLEYNYENYLRPYPYDWKGIIWRGILLISNNVWILLEGNLEDEKYLLVFFDTLF